MHPAKFIFGFSLLFLCLLGLAPAGAQQASDFCTGRKSCFMALNGPDRAFCQAYVEGKSCFMSFPSNDDRGWCQHIREGKSCFMALNGRARADCEANRIPREHRRWMNMCRR